MTKSILVAALLLLLGHMLTAEAQTLAGLKVGDDATELTALGQPIATEKYRSFLVRKWAFANGNEVSATTDATERIVYLESDWNGDDDATACDLSGLKFGVTTLSDIRKRFGSNGFTFKRRDGTIQVPDGTVVMSSYEVGNAVVTFITKVPVDGEQAVPQPKGSDIADRATLDAISISDPKYAENEWGERIYDPKYKKVEWK
ncbi:MAG TPA: hypothetical protein VMU28_14250 [Terriglobales bacterium]|nr:hypothetical protein [Terriglobales bacterium]